jgi:hypothetical protein
MCFFRLTSDEKDLGKEISYKGLHRLWTKKTTIMCKVKLLPYAFIHGNP